MSIAYLSLGSNLGNRQTNIQTAVTLLAEGGIHIVKSSTIIETDPVGGPLQGEFLNAVMKIQTDLTPHALLDLCQSIERRLKRVKTVVNGPRTIDVDILLYDDMRLHTPQLTIPHPRMLERDFVLIPLREIAPELWTNSGEFKNALAYARR